MLSDSFERMYVMLHGVAGKGGGHVRLEQNHRRARVNLSVHGLPASSQAIRALLVSENPTDGILWDLGLMIKGRNGQGSLRLDNISFPSGLPFSCYHTLALVTDWPQGELLMAGTLPQKEPLLRWQLQQIISRYLTVPVSAPKAAPPAKKVEIEAVEESPPNVNFTISDPILQPEPSPVEVPQPVAEAPIPDDLLTLAAAPDCPLSVVAIEEAPPEIIPIKPVAALKAKAAIRCPAHSSEPPVDGLQPIFWPESIAELKVYFSTLPPCAPFDAPGWRFVKVGLPHGGPANYCMVGIQVRDDAVRQIAYAVPGSRDQLPAPGLSGYRWQAGRGGQGYWTLWQNVKAS